MSRFMRVTRWLTVTSCLCAALVAATSPANANIILFAGSDPGANDNDPHPNSNAAAAAFDAAVSGITIFSLRGRRSGHFRT